MLVFRALERHFKHTEDMAFLRVTVLHDRTAEEPLRPVTKAQRFYRWALRLRFGMVSP